MKLQKAEYPNGCAIAALAMLLGRKQSDIVKFLGHDGSEIIWPEYGHYPRMRGAHHQEIIDAALHLGPRALVTIEAFPHAIQYPESRNAVPVWSEQDAHDRLQSYMDSYEGIIFGMSPKHIYHAVAWDRSKFFDPNLSIPTDGTALAIQTFLASL